MEFVSGSSSWNPINILRSDQAARAAFWLFIRRHVMRRFLIKKTGDCSGPPTPKITKSDAERLATAKEYEERRRRGLKAAWP